jgi:hypothetical protein
MNTAVAKNIPTLGNIVKKSASKNANIDTVKTSEIEFLKITLC